MSKRILPLLLILLGSYLLVSTIFPKQPLPNTTSTSSSGSSITLESHKAEYGRGETINLRIVNNHTAPFTLPSHCPLPPVVIEKNGKTASGSTIYTCPPDFTVAAHSTGDISLAAWEPSIFNEIGTYKISYALPNSNAPEVFEMKLKQVTQKESIKKALGSTSVLETDTELTLKNLSLETYQDIYTKLVAEKKSFDFSSFETELFAKVNELKNKPKGLSTEFRIVEPNFLGSLWNTVFYQPVYNALIFFATSLPIKDMGVAVILLTIMIRLLIFIPTHKSLEQQKRLQQIAPKIQELQEKYKDDKATLGQETMKLYKEYNVNPLSSCLPLLIQLPILIALYVAVQNGINPSSIVFLYEPLRNVNLSEINTIFLWFWNLSAKDFIFLPLIVAALQFVQMKLTLPPNKKKDEEEKKSTKDANQMEVMNKTMLYMLPILMFATTASLPSAVGIYLATTTIFSIAQQLIINKERYIPKNS